MDLGGFQFGVFVEGMQGFVVVDVGLFVVIEWCGYVVIVLLVDLDVVGMQVVCYVMCVAEVVCLDICGQVIY